MIPLFPNASLAALAATNAALTTTRIAGAFMGLRHRENHIPADNDEIGDVELPRKYSLAEIDKMRDDIERSYPTGVSYNGNERAAEVERRLRTYMMAGIEPEEIAAMRAEAMRRDEESGRWYQKMVNPSA